MKTLLNKKELGIIENHIKAKRYNPRITKINNEKYPNIYEFISDIDNLDVYPSSYPITTYDLAEAFLIQYYKEPSGRKINIMKRLLERIFIDENGFDVRINSYNSQIFTVSYFRTNEHTGELQLIKINPTKIDIIDVDEETKLYLILNNIADF